MSSSACLTVGFMTVTFSHLRIFSLSHSRYIWIRHSKFKKKGFTRNSPQILFFKKPLLHTCLFLAWSLPWKRSTSPRDAAICPGNLPWVPPLSVPYVLFSCNRTSWDLKENGLGKGRGAIKGEEFWELRRLILRNFDTRVNTAISIVLIKMLLHPFPFLSNMRWRWVCDARAPLATPSDKICQTVVKLHESGQPYLPEK